jgi:hypothetical protein
MLSNGSGEKTAILTYFTKKAIDLGEQHLVAKHNTIIVKHICYSMLRCDVLKLVTLLLPEAYLEGLDDLVRANMYPSRSAAIRAAVHDLLRTEIWTR